MNIDSLLKIIPTVEPDACDKCHKEKLRSWTNSNCLENSLTKLSDIEPLQQNGYDSYKKGKENPFSQAATVALSYYPYNESTVYQCNSCQSIILIYLERGGHAPRYQARWIHAGSKILP